MLKLFQTARFLHALLLLAIMPALTACVSTTLVKPELPAAAQQLKEQHLLSLQSIQQFSLQGRVGVQTSSKGFSGSLQWQHNRGDDDIALYSPLGGQVASIKKTSVQVTLEDSSGKIYSAADAETLTQSTLGWQLPLKGLADWAIGRPTGSPVQESIWNEQGLLTNLHQDGWKIEYQNYTEQDGYILPGKIFLRSDKLNLKLLVEKWNNVDR